jgi:predicted ATPase/class 3 adenylate cyclase
LAEVSFGEWLRRRRKALDLTQEQLAQQISCSTSELRKLEAEERRPSEQIIEQLAEVFHIAHNERTAFLRFARGHWQAAPTSAENAPWLFPQIHDRDGQSKSEIRLFTFLFTDIEGSTKLAQEHPVEMPALLRRYSEILNQASEAHNGNVFQVAGDSFSAAFYSPNDALNAVLEAQRYLQNESWSPMPIKVRMGIHTGAAQLNSDSAQNPYLGYTTLALTQRIMSAGHGGQILLSNATEALLRGQLPKQVDLRDIGEYKFKDVFQPVRVFQVIAPDLQKEFPALRALDVCPNNLPIQLTSFIGRNKEVRHIKKLLEQYPLVTLTGSGGIGKTRLSIQVASELLKEYPDGAWLVELAPVTDPSFVIQAVCAVLDVTPPGNTLALNTLTGYLRPKKILLIIDNCEHLIDACAQLAEALLHTCPDLQIIASSREAFGIKGESAYEVPSLSLVDSKCGLKIIEQSEAVRFFVERSRAILPGYTLTEANAPTIAQICSRLSGMPLAIELAAARVKMMSADEIAKRLDDRFELLTGGSRIAPPRHQTLRATIDWSHDLLTGPERILFRRLAVFAGGFTLEAAEAVCSEGIKRSDILDLLGRLVDKSLVTVERAYPVGKTRYRLLETIRQYALEKLVETREAPAIRDKHLEFFVKLAEEAEPKVFSNKSGIWWRLDKELNNFRAAMEWSTNSGKAVAALQIAGSLIYFWFVRGLVGSEWHDYVQPALSRPEGMKRTLARAKALNGIGLSYWADMYPADARPELEEALSIGRELSDSWTIATALRNLGLHAFIHSDYEEAQTLLEQSLQIWQEMGPEGRMGSSWTLIFLGEVALHQEQSERARLLLEKANTILREIGDHNFLAYSIRHLAQLAWREGNYENATTLCKESLTFNQEVGDLRGVIACLAGFADIAVGQGKIERAAKLMAAVENQLALIGTRLLILDKMEYERNLALLRAKLDEKTLARFWEKGKAMTMQKAIGYALEDIR